MQTLSIVRNGKYAPPVRQPTPPVEEDDASIARRIIDAGPPGDRIAETELFRRFGPRIRLYGLRHLRNDAGAADLVQDVLVLTLQKLREGAVREPSQIASFIFGTCRHVVMDARRGVRRREQLLDSFALDVAGDQEISGEPLDTHRLEQCLARLAERERSVLIMTFYDERPAEAVASEFGLTPGNVRVIRHRALERLRECVLSSGTAS
jgi:RNA polymerase sigma-70 factor (ECF subfamily)